MKDKSILRRAIAAIRRASGPFWSTEPVVRFNPVLTKWEQYYDARPNGFAHRRQVGAMSYFIQAD